MTWFYLHCVAAVVIMITDAKGTLEPTFNKFEEKIGIKTEVISDTTKIKIDVESYQYRQHN